MAETDFLEILRGFPTGNYTDVYLRLGIRGWTRGLKPVNQFLEGRVVGRATTVRYLPIRGRKSSSKKIYEVIRLSNPGDILVIQAPYPQEVIVGGLVTHCAKTAGLAGIVLDGYLRDLEEVKESGLPIWYKGTGMERSPAIELHDWNVDIDCAGAQIQPKDYIIADQDGVIVLTPEDIEEVIKNLYDLQNIEKEIENLIVNSGPLEKIYELFKRKGQKLSSAS